MGIYLQNTNCSKERKNYGYIYISRIPTAQRKERTMGMYLQARRTMSISPDKVLSSTARFNLLLAVINDEKSRGVLHHEKKTNNERKGKRKGATET
jgi:hypothetical protein